MMLKYFRFYHTLTKKNENIKTNLELRPLVDYIFFWHYSSRHLVVFIAFMSLPTKERLGVNNKENFSADFLYWVWYRQQRVWSQRNHDEHNKRIINRKFKISKKFFYLGRGSPFGHSQTVFIFHWCFIHSTCVFYNKSRSIFDYGSFRGLESEKETPSLPLQWSWSYSVTETLSVSYFPLTFPLL